MIQIITHLLKPFQLVLTMPRGIPLCPPATVLAAVCSVLSWPLCSSSTALLQAPLDLSRFVLSCDVQLRGVLGSDIEFHLLT